MNSAYPTLLTRYLLPLMEADQKKHGKRLVVFVTSFSAMMFSSPFASVYGASKSYTRALSKSLSEEYADGSIRFLSANMGYVATKMSKMKEGIWATNPESAVISCLRMHDQVDVIPHLKDIQWHFRSFCCHLFFLDKFPGIWLLVVASYRLMFDKSRGKRQSSMVKQVKILQ